MKCRFFYLEFNNSKFREKVKISKRAIQEETEEEDWLKQSFSKFSFSGLPIKFCEASITKDEVDQVNKFIQSLFE